MESDPLPETQLEILRLVNRRPGIRIHDVAAELGLASNTVSTLVHSLTAAGFVDRLSDAGDGRVARLGFAGGGGPPPALARRAWRDPGRPALRAGHRGPVVARPGPAVLERIVDSLDEEMAGGAPELAAPPRAHDG